MTRAKELSKEHSAYVRELLVRHGEDPWVVEKIIWHYETAMVHGYKHGVDETNKNICIAETGEPVGGRL